MNEIIRYNKARIDIENRFLGLRYEHTTLIKSLITRADPSTGVVSDITYNELARILTIHPAPGRKDSGTPTKQTIRNYIKCIERECGEYFQIISEDQKLQFLFSELPKIFKNREVNTDATRPETIVPSEQNNVSDQQDTIEVNIERNTPITAVKNINITNSNKQTQTASNDFSCSKKQIGDDFYPNAKTIEMALSMGLTKVTDFMEIQAFIKHNKKLNTQWADFNPVFITWLERDAQYIQKQQQKAQGQLRSHHNERGTNQSTLNQTALERVSQQHGISIESLWGNPSSELNSCEFIEGTLVLPMDEADCNLRAAFCQ